MATPWTPFPPKVQCRPLDFFKKLRFFIWPPSWFFQPSPMVTPNPLHSSFILNGGNKVSMNCNKSGVSCLDVKNASSTAGPGTSSDLSESSGMCFSSRICFSSLF